MLVNSIAAHPPELEESPISAVDLFCGAGGLTYGLRMAGIRVEAGIDIDSRAQYAFEENNPGSVFKDWDLGRKRPSTIAKLLDNTKVTLLAGCAPCQPFSNLTNGQENHKSWDLLGHFGCLIRNIKPDLVTMENVPELARRGAKVFDAFLSVLEEYDYCVDWKIVSCKEYGVPQNRHRLVLLASRLGEIKIPKGNYAAPSRWKTVKSAIGRLPAIASGETSSNDALHVAVKLSPLNMKRIKATKADGGSRKDWPKALVLDCHKKKSGKSYEAVYGRMWWDRPAPTMTTLCTGLGNGRFGHPKQDRAISLREAALLQSFPRDYVFWPSKQKLHRSAIARMIGNAVPPKLGESIGRLLIRHTESLQA